MNLERPTPGIGNREPAPGDGRIVSALVFGPDADLGELVYALELYGAEATSIESSDEGITFAALVDESIEDELLGDLRRRFIDVRVISRGDPRPPDDARGETLETPEWAIVDLSVLTDRQEEILELGVERGYYETPRENAGQDIAEMLDVSQPTFTKHERSAIRRIVDQLYPEEQ